MKPFFAILLSLLILAQPLSKMLLVVEYQVNKNYIAQVFCINKSRPQLHCEGKCQLSKELKAAEKHDRKLPAPVKEILEVVYFYQSFSSPELVQFSTENPQKFGQYLIDFPSSPANAVFHPPCYLA